MDHVIEKPIDLIYDVIEDLVEIGGLAGILYSPEQIVDLRYIILAKNRKWMRRPEANKTWAVLKNFFTKSISRTSGHGCYCRRARIP